MTVSVSHITHINNLASIIQENCLWSDAKRIELNLDNQNIGHSHIKQRRLNRLVKVSAGGSIGHYVPFNFCPRSVMLFVIHKGHQDYQGGQEQILHLISDTESIRMTNQHCFFTDIHADLDYADQIDDFTRINELNLDKIANLRYWQDYSEEKQAEFLAFESVNWHTISQIGVRTQAIAEEVHQLLTSSQHKPDVVIKPD